MIAEDKSFIYVIFRVISIKRSVEYFWTFRNTTYRTAADVTKIQSPCIRCLPRRPINDLPYSWRLPMLQLRIFDDLPNHWFHRYDRLSAPRAADIERLKYRFQKIYISWVNYSTCYYLHWINIHLLKQIFQLKKTKINIYLSLIEYIHVHVYYLDILAPVRSTLRSVRIPALVVRSADSPTNTWRLLVPKRTYLVRLNWDVDPRETAVDTEPDCRLVEVMTSCLSAEPKHKLMYGN